MMAGFRKPLRFALLIAGLAIAATGAASESRPRTLEGRVVDQVSGLGLAGVQVRLFDPDGVMMGLVETDGSGLYRIDLGTLDNDEIDDLHDFYIEVRRADGRNARRAIGKWSIADHQQIQQTVIALP